MRRCASTAFWLASLAGAVLMSLAMTPAAAGGPDRPALQPLGPAAPTFNKDVLPILQKNCQACHRDGAIAPMSLVTYEETRPYARAMARAVRTRTMPPWFADPAVGHFKNAKILIDADIATIADWAENGALEGDVKDKPAPVDFGEGWTIGKPDVIVTMPKDIDVPATGAIEQSNVLVRAHFAKDMWVKAAEVKPGNPRVVHHMKAWVRPPDSPWMKDAPEGEMYDPPRGAVGFDGTAPAPIALSATGYRPSQDILAKYNPGVEGQAFTTGSAAKFIAAGSDIVFEVHYTASGKPEKDRSSVGLVLADAPPEQRHLTTTAISASRFEIPAGDSNYEIKAETVVTENAKLVWVQPHMHYRGKDYELKVIYPSGEEVTVLRVPHYRFDWQVGYELAQPLDLPKGTKLRTVSHYDNSSANKFNPDPTRNIRFGAQSWDEMNVSFVGILIDAKANPARTFGGTRPLAPE
jgi:hypothetical protein